MKNKLIKPFLQQRKPSQNLEPQNSKKEDSFIIAYGIYGGVGFQLAIGVAGGVLGGQWLDKHWGTTPWLTLTGLVIGAVAGFYNLIKILNWKDSRS